MNIRESRLHIGLTQEQVARSLGVTVRHYIRIEMGEVEPKVKVALRLARLLEVDPYCLFDSFDI